MIQLDPRTVILVNFVYSSTVSCFIVAAWLLCRINFSGVGNWATGFSLFAINFFVLSFRNIFPDSIVTVLPHLATCLAYIEIKRGITKFYKLKDLKVFDFMLFISFAVVLILNQSDFKIRVASVIIVQTIIIIETAILVIISKIKTKKIFLTLFFITIVTQSIRLGLGLMWGSSVEPLSTGNNLSAMSILLFMNNVFVLFTLLFIVIQKTLDQKNTLLTALEQVSVTDELTQISNRRGFMRFADYEVARQKRKKVGFAIVLGDLDGFKNINDIYGHDAGDAILKQTAFILRNSIRESDVVARWGGEEFIMMLTDSTLSATVMVTERIREAVENHEYAHGNAKLKVTISLGIGHTCESQYDIDRLTKDADNNLYEAKRKGRNRVVPPAVCS